MDGQTVLAGSVDVYLSTPEGIQIGRNTLAGDVSAAAFRGKILNPHRLGVPPPPARSLSQSGPLQIKLRLPSSRGGPPQPLVSTGHTGTGDLLSVQIMDDGRIRFAHDSWGRPAITSPLFTADLSREHTIEVEMGSLYPPEQPGVTAEQRHRLSVRFDDELVLDTFRPVHASTPDEVEIGFNAIKASSAVGMFSGTILSVSRIPPRPRPVQPEAWGPLHLSVRLPLDANGLSEPLLASGVTGAADLIIIHYEDPSHIRISNDHWGYGGQLGPLIAVDYAKPHEIVITEGALFPPRDHPAWESHPSENVAQRQQALEVRVDGQVALSLTQATHPATPAQVIVGRNDVGASTCQPAFTGEILKQERLPW
jgi:hypothetical protein